MTFSTNVVFTGLESVEVSDLIQQLVNPGDKRRRNRDAADFFVLNEGDSTINLWDIPPVDASRVPNISLVADCNFWVHCIDLEKGITFFDKTQIALIKTNYPHKQHILVGIGQNADFSVDDREYLLGSQFDQPCVVDVGNEASLFNFKRSLFNFVKPATQLADKDLEEDHSHSEVNFHEILLECIDRLLDEDKKERLKQHINNFLENLRDPESEHAAIMRNFEKTCRRELRLIADPVAAEILAAVAPFVVAAVVTIIAGAIGFGIGFGLGLWSGPGAFFSGMAVAGSAASYVASTSIVSGLIAGGFTLFAAVRKTPASEVADAVHDFAEAELSSLQF